MPQRLLFVARAGLLFGLLVATGCSQTPPPANPTHFNVSVVSGGQTLLTWSSVENAEGYILERRTADGEFALIVQPSETRYLDPNLTLGQRYSYRLSTRVGAAHSSGITQDITLPSPLSAPQNFSAASSNTAREVRLSWQAVEDASYKLERQQGSGSFALVFEGNQTSFTDTDVAANTTYQYRLMAVNALLQSPDVQSNLTTPSAPAAPGNLKAVATSPSEVKLTWDEVSGASYTVSRRSGETSFNSIATTNTAKHIDSGLSGFTTYWYQLKAVNAWGESPDIQTGLTTFPDETGFAVSNQYAQQGYFAPPRENWPVLPTFAMLTPPDSSGKHKIFAWYSRDEYGQTLATHVDLNRTGTMAALYDFENPQNPNPWELVNNNNHTDLFCAGFSILPDGKIYTAGGHLGYDRVTGYPPGSKHTDIFDPVSKTWSAGPDMADGRWYPSLITLADGRLLIMAGSSLNKYLQNGSIASNPGDLAPQVEIWNTQTGQIQDLSGANIETSGMDVNHYYPWLFQAPNGYAFLAGANVTMAYLDVSGNGRWLGQQRRSGFWEYRDYGSPVMYKPGKIIGFGGGYGNTANPGGTDRIFKIDLDFNHDGNPANDGIAFHWETPDATMLARRIHLNATLLPDGNVFVNGGNQTGRNWLYDGATLEAQNRVSEIWNPEIHQRRAGATAAKVRQYHSAALLLPDGRVWTGGGGGCICFDGGRSLNQLNSEIYYPYYLFKPDGQLAPRPSITDFPRDVGYGSSFTLSTDLPAQQIAEVRMIKLGAVTHAFNMGQHPFNPAIVARDGNTLTLQAPTGGAWAPPGFYLTFAIDQNGVPSQAKTIRVQ